MTVVDVPVVVVVPVPGVVLVRVVLSSATPLLFRYVERVLSVCVPSEPVAFVVVVVLSVPAGGATNTGGVTVVVVVDCDEVDCAEAIPVMRPSIAAVVSRSLVMRYLSGDVGRNIDPGTHLRIWWREGFDNSIGIYSVVGGQKIQAPWPEFFPSARRDLCGGFGFMQSNSGFVECPKNRARAVHFGD